MDSLGFEKLVAALDVNAVVRSRWGYADEAEGQAALDEAVAALRQAGGVEATCRHGYFRTTKPEPEVVEFHAGAAYSVPFRFPREPAGERRSVADFYAGDDMAAAFCVTLGRRATDYLAGLKAARDSSAYLRAHGLLAGLAEAAAELTHNRISLELSGRGAASRGKRYSFGFPGCPGVEANAPLLALLDGARIGLQTTEGHQLDPEFSVTAIVIQRAQARYVRT
jgi:5-methyltetrahydrofolate--homocysteine methyltransferase